MWRFVTFLVFLKTSLASYEGNVHLVGGHVSHEGRVEVYHSSQWATVCGDSWDLEDAHVVCRQLGFPEALATIPRVFFGEGNSSQTIVTVSCSGYESGLLECSYSENTDIRCGHYEDAGVVCSDGVDVEGKLRFAGGSTPREGRVEIYHGGEWGTICDDYWLPKEGMVACRQLGFNGVTSTSVYITQEVEQRPNQLSDVDCTGYESRIQDCSHSSWGSTCSIESAAAIECSGGPYAQEYDVRLVDGPSPQAGRIEVFHENSWGTICDNTWSSTEAEVVCDQQGYDDVDVALEYFGPGDGAIHINSLSCDGGASSLEFCQYVNFSSTGCDHTEDVGVRCKNDSDGSAALKAYTIFGIVLCSLVLVCSVVVGIFGRTKRPHNSTAAAAAAALTVSGAMNSNGTTATAPSVTLNPSQIQNHPLPAGDPQSADCSQLESYPQSTGHAQSAGYPQPPPSYDSVVNAATDDRKSNVAPPTNTSVENPQQMQLED
ncbi:CD5 antigen-like [Diadema setosum]|uniref:CD5 antigen-like n=1 Tax=Diadema setosum TaxID=31175 RepID=UPI003B3A313E